MKGSKENAINWRQKDSTQKEMLAFPPRFTRNWWGQVVTVLLLYWVTVRVQGYRAADIQIDFTERHKSLGTEAQRAILKKYNTTHENFGKETVHPKVQFNAPIFMSVILVLRNLRTHLKKKPWFAPAETRGKWQRYLFSSSKTGTKLHSSRLRMLGVYQHHPWRNQRLWNPWASMHTLSGKDLNLAELETVRVSRNPTTVITANGEVNDLDLFVTAQILEDTPTVLSHGTLCEDHGYFYERTSGQNTTSYYKRQGKCDTTRRITSYHCSRLVNPTFQLVCEYILNIGIAGFNGRWFYAMSSNPHDGVNAVGHGPVPDSKGTKKRKSKGGHQWSTEKPVAWSAGMAGRVQGHFGRWKCSRTPRRFQFFSWISFRAAMKSGVPKDRNC